MTGAFYVGYPKRTFSLSPGGDGNTLKGYISGYDYKYEVVFKRANPSIEHVSVSPEAFDYHQISRAWKFAVSNGNLPRIRITLRGEDLPYKFGGYADVEFDDPEFIYQSYEASKERREITLFAWLDKRMEPGRKRVTVNGATVEFDLTYINDISPPYFLSFIIAGTREQALTTGRSDTVGHGRTASQGFPDRDNPVAPTPIPVGEIFWVKTEMSALDDRDLTDEKTVQLRWPSGSAELTLQLVDRRRRIYLGGPYFNAPPAAEGVGDAR